MKKKIGFVPMDPTLGAWLLEMLAKEPPESENAGELCAGVQDLLRGEVTSLLLSASGEGEAPAPAESLQLGELEIFPKSRRVLMQGREISLTPKEFDILWFLAQNRGECSPKNRSTGRCGRITTCWMTATSWPLSASCGKRSSRTQTHLATS